MGFGSKFRALNRSQVAAAATPPSGRSQEAIWHAVYDTQTYVDNTTSRLVFFGQTNADKTLSNMEASGQFPSPQSFMVHNICCDLWNANGVSTAAGGVDGQLNDLALLLLVGRPTWTLEISSKKYGPYPLTALHGTGGPTGFGWGTFTAEESLQYARNEPSPGWNYYGRIIIPEQVSFSVELNWAAPQNVSADHRIRVTMFGVLNRRVV